MHNDLPGPSGLYDPRFEHDACGVSFVAHLHGRSQPFDRCHGHRRAVQPRAPWRHGRGGRLRRRRRHPHPGPGPVPAGRLRVRPARRPAVTRSGWRSCPTSAWTPRRRWRRSSRIVADEGLTVLGWREVPIEPDYLGATARSVMPTFRHLVHRRSRRRERHRARPQGVHRPQADRARVARRTAHVLSVAVVADPRVQGHVHDAAARAGVHRPAGRAGRERPRARALPVLHEHLPELAARPSVPVHRPQRRDQHRAGQPQLDAHARGDARQRPPARPRAGVPDLHARRQRLGHVRRGARAAAPRRPQHGACDVDDDPGGVGEPRVDGSGDEGVLPVPLLDDGAVGRPRQRRLHRRHRDRRRARPQRPPARAATGSPTTISS